MRCPKCGGKVYNLYTWRRSTRDHVNRVWCPVCKIVYKLVETEG